MKSRSVCVILVLMGLAAACGTPGVINPLSRHSYPARSANYPIALFDDVCPQPYEVIAEVTTKAYDDRVVDITGKEELRAMARKMGGDAVIRVSRNGVVREEVGYRPGALFRMGTRFVDRYTLSGVVVRYSAKP